jgi:hypothetical protein
MESVAAVSTVRTADVPTARLAASLLALRARVRTVCSPWISMAAQTTGNVLPGTVSMTTMIAQVVRTALVLVTPITISAVRVSRLATFQALVELPNAWRELVTGALATRTMIVRQTNAMRASAVAIRYRTQDAPALRHASRSLLIGRQSVSPRLLTRSVTKQMIVIPTTVGIHRYANAIR